MMTPDIGGDPFDQLRSFDFNFSRAEKDFESGNFRESIRWVESCLPPTHESRAIEAQARYRFASELIAKRHFDAAETELKRIPHGSSINRFLIEERIGLLRKRRVASSDLREMESRLGDVCNSCRGKDLYTIATCPHRKSGVPPVLKLASRQFPFVLDDVYAAAPYRSRWDKEWADPMSRLLRLRRM